MAEQATQSTFTSGAECWSLEHELRSLPGDSDDNRVLVVEDSAVHRLIAESLLKKLGFKVDFAEDGAKAIKCACATNYCFILMDCQLPLLDGLKVTQRIREGEKHTGRHAAIVGHTARYGRQECIDAGMDDFTHKPCCLNELIRLAVRFCDKRNWLLRYQ